MAKKKSRRRQQHQPPRGQPPMGPVYGPLLPPTTPNPAPAGSAPAGPAAKNRQMWIDDPSASPWNLVERMMHRLGWLKVGPKGIKAKLSKSGTEIWILAASDGSPRFAAPERPVVLEVGKHIVRAWNAYTQTRYGSSVRQISTSELANAIRTPPDPKLIMTEFEKVFGQFIDGVRQ